MSEDKPIGNRKLGEEPQMVLGGVSDVVRDWLAPFLERWIAGGRQPLSSPEETKALEEWIKRQEEGKALPDGYAWLPGFLARLAGSMRFNQRNFVNIHPTPHVPAAVASLLVALQNPNNIVRDVSEATTGMEEECVAWMAEKLLGFDAEKAWGHVVSGGTIANMTALLVARDYTYRKLARPRPAHVRARGLYGQPEGVVLATAGSHYSIRKALWVLGMGDENVVSIPVAYDEEVEARGERDRVFVRGISKTEWGDLIRNQVEEDRARGREEMRRFYAGEQEPFGLQPLASEVYKALYGCFAYNTPLIAYVFTVGTTDTGTVELADDKVIARLVDEDVYT